jgi:hypothetical protein
MKFYARTLNMFRGFFSEFDTTKTPFPLGYTSPSEFCKKCELIVMHDRVRAEMMSIFLWILALKKIKIPRNRTTPQ